MSTRARRSRGGNTDAGLNPAMIQLLDLSRLRQELKARGLDTKGTKQVLADRLQMFVECGGLPTADSNSENAVASTPSSAKKKTPKKEVVEVKTEATSSEAATTPRATKNASNKSTPVAGKAAGKKATPKAKGKAAQAKAPVEEPVDEAEEAVEDSETEAPTRRVTRASLSAKKVEEPAKKEKKPAAKRNASQSSQKTTSKPAATVATSSLEAEDESDVESEPVDVKPEKTPTVAAAKNKNAEQAASEEPEQKPVAKTPKKTQKAKKNAKEVVSTAEDETPMEIDIKPLTTSKTSDKADKTVATSVEPMEVDSDAAGSQGDAAEPEKAPEEPATVQKPSEKDIDVPEEESAPETSKEGESKESAGPDVSQIIVEEPAAKKTRLNSAEAAPAPVERSSGSTQSKSSSPPAEMAKTDGLKHKLPEKSELEVTKSPKHSPRVSTSVKLERSDSDASDKHAKPKSSVPAPKQPSKSTDTPPKPVLEHRNSTKLGKKPPQPIDKPRSSLGSKPSLPSSSKPANGSKPLVKRPVVRKPPPAPSKSAVDLLDSILDNQSAMLEEKYKSEQDRSEERQQLELEKRRKSTAAFVLPDEPIEQTPRKPVDRAALKVSTSHPTPDSASPSPIQIAAAPSPGTPGSAHDTAHAKSIMDRLHSVFPMRPPAPTSAPPPAVRPGPPPGPVPVGAIRPLAAPGIRGARPPPPRGPPPPNAAVIDVRGARPAFRPPPPRGPPPPTAQIVQRPPMSLPISRFNRPPPPLPGVRMMGQRPPFAARLQAPGALPPISTANFARPPPPPICLSPSRLPKAPLPPAAHVTSVKSPPASGSSAAQVSERLDEPMDVSDSEGEGEVQASSLNAEVPTPAAPASTINESIKPEPAHVAEPEEQPGPSTVNLVTGEEPPTAPEPKIEQEQKKVEEPISLEKTTEEPENTAASTVEEPMEVTADEEVLPPEVAESVEPCPYLLDDDESDNDDGYDPLQASISVLSRQTSILESHIVQNGEEPLNTSSDTIERSEDMSDTLGTSLSGEDSDESGSESDSTGISEPVAKKQHVEPATNGQVASKSQVVTAEVAATASEESDAAASGKGAPDFGTLLKDPKLLLMQASNVLKNLASTQPQIQQEELEGDYEVINEEKPLPDFHGEPVPDDEDDDDALFEKAAGLPKRKKEPAPIKEEPLADERFIELDYYNADFNVKAHDKNKWLIDPDNGDGFALMWGGVRSNYGIVVPQPNTPFIRVAFQVQISEFLSLKHIPFEETDPHDIRIGWSVKEASNALGMSPKSYAFTSMQRKAIEGHFMPYGEDFQLGDVITSVLDLENQEIRYYKNDKDLGAAFAGDLFSPGDIVFPHVAIKNCKVFVNFGQEVPNKEEAERWKLPESVGEATFVACLDRTTQMRASRRPPESKSDCSIVMLIGIPGVGKTTWAEGFIRSHPDENWIIFNTEAILERMKVNNVPRHRLPNGRPDMILGLVAKALNRTLQMACRRRHNYVIDQTNCNRDVRKRRLALFEGFNRKCVVIIPNEQVAEERRLQHERTDPYGEMPIDALLEFKANLSLPNNEFEPFEDVLYIEPPLERISEAIEQVERYNTQAQPWTRKGKQKRRQPAILSDHRGLGGPHQSQRRW